MINEERKTDIVRFECSAGLLSAKYSYKNENGNSSPNELYFQFEQFGDVTQDRSGGISITFYGDWEHSGFIAFVHKIAKKFPQRKLPLMEKLRLKIKQWLLT